MNKLLRFFRPRVDVPMLAALLFLLGFGVVIVYSSSSVFAAQQYGDATYFLKRQAAFAIAGLVALVVAASIDPSTYEKHGYKILGGAFALLLLVLIPGIGHSAGGARRWIQIGPFGLQAGEVMKFALVVYLAK